MTVSRQPIRAFISYAHELGVAGHRERVLELAQSLRVRGIEATIDQFMEHDPPVWPRWMLDQVRAADFVLCVASRTYKERVESRGEPTIGRGARWEGAIITEEFYAEFPRAHKKFIAVVLNGWSPEDIPDVLMPLGRSYYVLPGDDEDLYRRLTGQQRVVPAPLGTIVRLGPA